MKSLLKIVPFFTLLSPFSSGMYGMNVQDLAKETLSLTHDSENPPTLLENGATSLHWACQHSNKETVQLLIDKAFALTAVDTYGSNCLHYAAKSNTLEMIKYLMNKQQFPVKAINNVGATYLHYAVQSNTQEVAQFFIDQGLTIDDKDFFEADCIEWAHHAYMALVDNEETDKSIRDLRKDMVQFLMDKRTTAAKLCLQRLAQMYDPRNEDFL